MWNYAITAGVFFLVGVCVDSASNTSTLAIREAAIDAECAEYKVVDRKVANVAIVATPDNCDHDKLFEAMGFAQ